MGLDHQVGCISVGYPISKLSLLRFYFDELLVSQQTGSFLELPCQSDLLLSRSDAVGSQTEKFNGFSFG